MGTDIHVLQDTPRMLSVLTVNSALQDRALDYPWCSCSQQDKCDTENHSGEQEIMERVSKL